MWGIGLQRRSGISMARQLYRALRDRMTQGGLKPGEALPSTREMARQLGISRNTACEAYAMLADEGFIHSSPGAPTRVAAGLVLEGERHPAQMEQIKPAIRSYAADFRTGRPDLRRFPFHQWRLLIGKGAEELPPEQWDYAGPEGLPALREEIAQWLMRSRGLEERPQDIFITAGSTQALHLLAGLPELKAGEIIVEDPCHTGMLGAWQAMGFAARPVPADGSGLQTGLLEGMDASNARAVYVTPSHQFPLGGILPAARRAELIRFAGKNGLFIIEDDYDSEFRYAGAPVAPLRSMDGEHVAYVGTFSKSLFPALRIGFAVLPAALQAHWAANRRVADVQNPPFGQAALAEFLRTRKFDRHVRLMRRLYGQRREALLQALEDVFGSACIPLGDAAGLHVALRFPGMRFDGEFSRQARVQGIRVTPAEFYCIKKGEHADKLIVGFGHLEPDAIRSAVVYFSDFIRRNAL